MLARMSGFAAAAALARRGEAQIVRQHVTTQSSAQAVIFVNLVGAPSHVDTFDLKPGPWILGNPIIDSAGPITLNRALFPNLFRLAGDLCIIRSIESSEAAHDRGQFFLQTGHSSNPAFNAETPHIGAVIAHEFEGKSAGNFPAFLSLNGPTGQGAAFFDGTVDPVQPPAAPSGFADLQHSYYEPDTEQLHFNLKYQLLQNMDEVRDNPYDPLVAAHAAYSLTAKAMMYDPKISNVFLCSNDDLARYGSSTFGISCIMARQAIQAHNGVRFINIPQSNWDTHQSMYDPGYTLAGVPNNIIYLSKELDRGIGAMIDDLKASGDLATTLIVIMGEFGRTPGPLNGREGRDHHQFAMCCVMVGGGVQGGNVIGATDSIGRYITDPGWSQDRHIYIPDIAATIYSAIGIDWTTSIRDTPSGREYDYVPPIPAQSCLGCLPAPIQEVFGAA